MFLLKKRSRASPSVFRCLRSASTPPGPHRMFAETTCKKEKWRCVQGAWKNAGAEVVNYVIINAINLPSSTSLRMIHLLSAGWYWYPMQTGATAAAAPLASVSGRGFKSVNLSILKLQMKGQQMATVQTTRATRPSIRFISLKCKMTQVDCVCVSMD